jgi:putative NADPH-quinone reductase
MALVLVFHPDLENSRVNRAWIEAARDSGHVVRDLYRVYEESSINISLEQALCSQSDSVVFQHPMHWYSSPWLMKRWIDDVLSYGWAYGPTYSLAGKKWRHAVTIGAGQDEYHRGASREYTAEEFLRPFERTAAFCRMHYDQFLRFGAGYAEENEIGQWTSEYVEWLSQP